jgi:hypothetical protein
VEVEDLAGNLLEPYSWSFTTQSKIKNMPPVIFPISRKNVKPSEGSLTIPAKIITN